MTTTRQPRIRYVVSRRRGRWVLTQAKLVLGEHPTQAAAIADGAEHGRADWAEGNPAELIIKGADGRIRDSRTYGRDPRRTRG